MNFKKKYDYILKNEVDISIYDRFRELIKEFGEEEFRIAGMVGRCHEEKMFHMNNQENIQKEIDAAQYIEDEINHDLLSAIKKRKEKLYRIREYTKNRVVINDEIYIRNVERCDSIWFSTDGRELTLGAFPKYYSIDTKEPMYKVSLYREREKEEIFNDGIELEGVFNYEQLDKLIKYYVIDKKLDLRSIDIKNEEYMRDLKLEILMEI